MGCSRSAGRPRRSGDASFDYDASVGGSPPVGDVTTTYLHDGLNPISLRAADGPTTDLLTGLGLDDVFAALRRPIVDDDPARRPWLYARVGGPDGGSCTTYAYEPYGRSTVSCAIDNPFRFTGREDDGTGLMFFRAATTTLGLPDSRSRTLLVSQDSAYGYALRSRRLRRPHRHVLAVPRSMSPWASATGSRLDSPEDAEGLGLAAEQTPVSEGDGSVGSSADVPVATTRPPRTLGGAPLAGL